MGVLQQVKLPCTAAAGTPTTTLPPAPPTPTHRPLLCVSPQGAGGAPYGPGDLLFGFLGVIILCFGIKVSHFFLSSLCGEQPCGVNTRKG